MFRELRADGTIPEGIRFQVSLPTPIAVIGAFVAGPQGELEHRYEARLLDELAVILDAIPPEDLAVQWDAAVEFAIFEGIFPSWFGSDYPTQLEEVGQRLIRLGAAVSEPVELGYHLCYGDFGHRHFAEPADTGRLAAVAGRVLAGLERPVNWIHLPVPRSRTDAAYFEPLADLALPPETDLYLGLVHATDGRAGALQRIEAARGAVAEFGIATECGMGRRPADQIPALFDLHAGLADTLA
ncbi:hypothetical protein [Nocardia asiatica]|uniref:hypothetical protein n=1 Tax=Nocardia asiatica TaxID=209252 RepID=UPI003EE16AD6